MIVRTLLANSKVNLSDGEAILQTKERHGITTKIVIRLTELFQWATLTAMYIFRKRKLHLSTMKHVVKVAESERMRTMMMNFVTMITTSELRKLSNTSRNLRS